MIIKPELNLPTIQLPTIPDSLEGVMEGATRLERYKAFQQRVIGKIWPNSPLSGEYGDDYFRSTRFDEGDISGFTQFGPLNRDPQNLTAEEFEQMVTQLGTPDYIRLRSVHPQLLNPEASIMVVGGSCILETAAMRTTSEMRKGIETGDVEPSALADFSRQVVAMAPTITHISGGMLGGQRQSIHFNESDMWAERLADYGIPREEADKITMEAYRRINDALERRTKLMNPKATMLHVNFDELALQPAIGEWLANVGEEYDPAMRILEVIYTYVGPNQLQLVQDAMQTRLDQGEFRNMEEREVAEQVLFHTTHLLRAKQIDHGRFKSMDLPKDVIVGNREPSEAELKKFEGDPVYRVGTKLMRDVYIANQTKNATAIYAGFADLPGSGNKIQHESRDMGMTFAGKPGEKAFLESVQAQLANPARLHRLNIDAHLQYLQTYTADDKVVREELIQEKQSLIKRLGEVTKPLSDAQKKYNMALERINGFQSTIQNAEAITMFVTAVTDNEAEISPAIMTVANTLVEQKKKTLEGLKKKPAEKRSDIDIQDMQDLPALIETLTQIGNGLRPEISETIARLLNDMKSGAEKSSDTAAKLAQQKQIEIDTLTREIETLQAGLQELTPKQTRLEIVAEQLKLLQKTSVFPLSDNPFIHHAMNFLWDSDFAEFMKRAVDMQEEMTKRRSGAAEQIRSIEAELSRLREEYKNTPDKSVVTQAEAEAKITMEPLTREEANIRGEYNVKMKQLMATIYPKLEAYINYLYGRADYPVEMRALKIFNS